MHPPVITKTGTDTEAATSPLRAALHARIKGCAEPLFVFEGRVIPAASVWTGARLWIKAFREAGLVKGDRIVLALDPGPAFLMVLVAGLWEGLTVAVADSGATFEEELDARVVIHPERGGWSPDEHSNPPRKPGPVGEALLGSSEAACLLMRTSGTAGAPKWVGLSDTNVMAVVDSHGPALGVAGKTVLSVLPWKHCFGLIIDLLTAALHRATIVRDERCGREPERCVALAVAHGIDWISMVPLQAERLARTAGGMDLLRSLEGGVIGGAPVGAELAALLQGTNLRVGYGQTEASPGITLGEPGAFDAGFIGSAVGCEVRTDDRGVLSCKGANVCCGYWAPGTGFAELDGDRWLDTGDLVETRADGHRFLGRVSGDFKLSNGRRVLAAELERAIASVTGGEVVVATLDGRRVDVALVGARDIDRGRVLAAAGALREKVGVVDAVGDSPAVRTPKGTLERRRVIEALAELQRVTARAA